MSNLYGRAGFSCSWLLLWAWLHYQRTPSLAQALFQVLETLVNSEVSGFIGRLCRWIWFILANDAWPWLILRGVSQINFSLALSFGSNSYSSFMILYYVSGTSANEIFFLHEPFGPVEFMINSCARPLSWAAYSFCRATVLKSAAA